MTERRAILHLPGYRPDSKPAHEVLLPGESYEKGHWYPAGYEDRCEVVVTTAEGRRLELLFARGPHQKKVARIDDAGPIRHELFNLIRVDLNGSL